MGNPAENLVRQKSIDEIRYDETKWDLEAYKPDRIEENLLGLEKVVAELRKALAKDDFFAIRRYGRKISVPYANNIINMLPEFPEGREPHA
jgi:hypothetical protein